MSEEAHDVWLIDEECPECQAEMKSNGRQKWCVQSTVTNTFVIECNYGISPPVYCTGEEVEIKMEGEE